VFLVSESSKMEGTSEDRPGEVVTVEDKPPEEVS
jgi:hypothetical protein